MRTAYTTHNSWVWRSFKAVSKARDERSFLKVLYNSIHDAYVSKSRHSMNSLMVCGYCEWLWRYRRIQHYFLAPGVAEFCIGAVKELSSEYRQTMPICRPVQAPDDGDLSSLRCLFTERDSDGRVPSGFAIHIPLSDPVVGDTAESFIVVPRIAQWDRASGTKLPSDNRSFAYVGQGEAGVRTNEDESLMCLIDPSNTLHSIGDKTDRIMRFLYGFSLYMEAFSDSVIAPSPGDITDVDTYHGQCKLVTVSKDMVDDLKNRLLPHFRRGHFMLLSSERYVNKRFQVVYRKGTFVRGRASEVDTDSHGFVGMSAIGSLDESVAAQAAL